MKKIFSLLIVLTFMVGVGKSFANEDAVNLEELYKNIDNALPSSDEGKNKILCLVNLMASIAEIQKNYIALETQNDLMKLISGSACTKKSEINSKVINEAAEDAKALLRVTKLLNAEE